jgi:hypothetical protein
MNKDCSIHLEFCGVGEPKKLPASAALAEATAFPENRFTNVATTEKGSRWFPTAQRILGRFACVVAFACALATGAPRAMADSADRGEQQPPGTLTAGEKIVAIQLLPNQRELRTPISQEAPDVLLRILVYGSAVVVVAILIGNCLSRERRLVAEIQAGTQRQRRNRRVRPPAPWMDEPEPSEKSDWQDVQGHGMMTVP